MSKWYKFSLKYMQKVQDRKEKKKKKWYIGKKSICLMKWTNGETSIYKTSIYKLQAIYFSCQIFSPILLSVPFSFVSYLWNKDGTLTCIKMDLWYSNLSFLCLLFYHIVWVVSISIFLEYISWVFIWPYCSDVGEGIIVSVR